MNLQLLTLTLGLPAQQLWGLGACDPPVLVVFHRLSANISGLLMKAQDAIAWLQVV